MRNPGTALFQGLFFLSGMTALAAEVVLSKLLSYVFGSSHLATATVLAAYMAGLSAGAWFFGRIVTGRRPIVIYACLELAIGVSYLLLPYGYPAFQELALATSAPFADQPATLSAVRFTLSFALVFVPTLMMGGTLPALVAAFRGVAPLEQSLSKLYAVNTLGAALGALLASYASIPVLGLDGTMMLAAAINVFVGVSAIVAHRRYAALAAVGVAFSDTSQTQATLPAEPRLSPRAAALIALVQGAVSFSLQVVWFHLIGSVIGVTVYAFSLMLVAILLGIGGGSLLVPWLRRRTGASTYGLFTGALLTMALGVAVSLFLWDRFSHVIDWLPRMRGNYSAFFGREAIRLGYCLLLLGPTTLAMGVSLPALAASVRPDGESEARRVGRVFAANTLGTIIGSVSTGFFLVGRFDSDSILRGAVVVLVALGLSALYLGRVQGENALGVRARRSLLGMALAAAAVALLFPGFDLPRLTRGNHYYWWPTRLLDRGPLAAVREDAQSGYVTVTEDATGVRTLWTNGKYEGSNAAGEFQDLFALLGGLYLKRYERAAIIGVGPARTLRTLHEMPFRHIDAVEYSPGIIDLARDQFAVFSKAAFEDTERVRVVVDDGRNFLQLSPHRYDYVAVAISGAAFAGASNIYSRDFFRAVDRKLDDRGVFLLWIQVHSVDPVDVRSVVFTVKTVFPSVHLYLDRSSQQGFIVASRSALVVDPQATAALEQNPAIREILDQHYLGSVLELTRDAVLVSDEDLQRYLLDPALAEPQVLSDLRPIFEYSTPYGLAVPFRPYDIRARAHGGLPRFAPVLSDEDEAYLMLVKEAYLAPVSPPAGG